MIAPLPRAVPGIAAAVALLHLVTNAGDRIFRDELYYLACADHLDWGYVDHPPFSILVLWAWRAIFGDSLAAIRVLPALLHGALVLIAAGLARKLGGGIFAQALSALAAAVAPLLLGINSIYSMNAFDHLFWALLAAIVIHIVQTDDRRWWLAFGAVAGLGLQNKISVLFFCAGLAVAIVLTPLRRHLRSPQLWLGAALAMLLFVPHVMWQATHGWPTLEFIENAKRYKIAVLTPWQFLTSQLLQQHPLNAPLWLLGLAALLFGSLRRFRALGVVYLVAFLMMALQRSKPYYLGPGYLMLLAAGAVAAERLTAAARWARVLVLTLLVLGGALTAPLAMPVLPVERFIAYQAALGMAPGTDENHALGPLPQFYADRFGWAELAATVASVYHALPAEERATTLIVGSNYGEAGAIDYFGPRHGLPRASSQHNSYYLWGPTLPAPAVVITIGQGADGPGRVFEEVTPAARFSHPYAMPYEQRHPILVCRRFKVPLQEAWERGKHFN